MKADVKLTAIFEEQQEGGYIGYVQEIAGVNTQGDTLIEVRENLIEALMLILEAQRQMSEDGLMGKEVIRENIDLTANEKSIFS